LSCLKRKGTACGVEGGIVQVEDSHQLGVHGGQIRALAQLRDRGPSSGSHRHIMEKAKRTSFKGIA